MKDLYLAAGCFWGAQRYFDKMDGVLSTTVGFANGHVENPSYKLVYTDTTGHAETVKIVYDPDVIGLESLLHFYFMAIDPLSLNRQGEAEGPRYRTGIYYTSAEDLPVIRKAADALSATLGRPLAVEILPLDCFYPAEEYHQDYLSKNPGGYCHLSPALFAEVSAAAGRKKAAYKNVEKKLLALLEGEDDPVVMMAETAAVLKDEMDFFWTGFYRVEGDTLLLGPFQGPVACIRIPFGKGVCGTAWKEDRTVVVPDVEEFPGHIACSSLSRSEIVVPLRKDGSVSAVLDIDSKETGTFDSTDALCLERLIKLVFD